MPKTGATRYQKFLKSEKSKVKLKAKKELPKGTNVTKTSFKVKKIIIKEQLRTHDSKDLFLNKHTIKELFLRITNSNTNIRLEALKGLFEIVNNRTEELKQHLGTLLLNVTPLILHVEKAVRHESLKLLHAVLSTTSIDKIEAYFHVISTYLRSAMTHIDSKVQEDSLLFLDVLLSFTPKLITKYFHKIFPSFMDMISKFKTDSNAVRTLTVNLNSKMTSVKWRIQAFQRLEYFLDQYIQHHLLPNESPDLSNACKPVSFDENCNKCWPLTNQSYVSICQLSFFSYKNQDLYEENENSKFKDYMSILMPLMYESWLEVCPSKKGEKSKVTIINTDAAVLLTHLLNTALLLSKIVKTQDVNCQSFIGTLVKHFPFHTNARTKQNEMDKEKNIISDSKMKLQNLKICYLFLQSPNNINRNNKQYNEEFHSVISYLENIINDDLEDDVCKYAVNVLHSLFFVVKISSPKYPLLQGVLEKLILTYFKAGISKDSKQFIFELLCEIALSNNLQYLHTIESFEKWINSLPEILLENSVLMSTVNVLHKYAVRSNANFNKIVKQKWIDIINNLPHIVIADSPVSESYHKLYSILYYFKFWDAESLNAIETQLLENEYKDEYNQFVLDILKSRCEGN